jgi:hypothetical protein
MPGEDENKSRTVLLHEVSAGYFDVLRIPIVLGRNFQPGEADRNIILINETMAKLYWPKESPLGKTVESDRKFEVAGVVKDAYTSDIGHVEATMYKPISGSGTPHLLIRGTGAGSWEPVVAAAKRIDSRVEVRTALLAENLDRWLESSRMGASIAGVLGVLALALATVGVFGVFAYILQQRTQEIGIRMALGAQPMQVVSVILRPGSRALIIGLAAGIAGAMGGSRLIESQLYGLSPLDPVSYGGVALLLSVAGVTASYLPARRATRVDPVIALRYE